jgi:hypothetical protein
MPGIRAEPRLGHKFFELAVSVNLKGLAGLNTGKDTNQTFGKVVPGSHLPSQVFFSDLTGGKIFDGSEGAPRQGLRRLP